MGVFSAASTITVISSELSPMTGHIPRLSSQTWRLSHCFLTIDAPGAVTTNALSINNAGDIVGIAEGTAERAFLLSKGQFANVDIGASATEATGINDRGDVVGTFTDSHGQHGFLIE